MIKQKKVYPGQPIKIPLPQNKTELAILTKWYFGVELHLKRFSCGSYEIEEDFNSYNKRDWLKNPYPQQHLFNVPKGPSNFHYDYSMSFWGTVFGRLTCGGIARASYGQYDTVGHRHSIRLNKLEKSLRSENPDLVRPFFARLVGS